MENSTLNRFVLVSMADVWDNSSRGMRNHLHRIYSPGWNNIKKLPEFFQSGTPWEFAKRTVDVRPVTLSFAPMTGD